MDHWLPSLNALRAFEVISRHLNYPDAATELGVSPAAVKQLVRKLEDTLGMALIERQGRGLALTAKGEDAARDLTRAFRQIRDTVDALRRPAHGHRLIVTSDPSFAALWLMPRLERFRALHPAIEVLVDSSPQIADLEGGQADVAIRFGAPPDQRLSVRRLFNEKLAAYCSPSLAAGPPGLRTIDDLANAPLLRWDLSAFQWASTTARWNRWRYWLSQVGAGRVEPADGLRFNDYNIAFQAAIAGQGVIIGSVPVLRDYVEAGLLVNPFVEVADTGIGYDLVTAPSVLDREEVASFCDWIVSEAGEAS